MFDSLCSVQWLFDLESTKSLLPLFTFQQLQLQLLEQERNSNLQPSAKALSMKPSYENLALVPYVVAELACTSTYDGSHMKNITGVSVQQTEEARRNMTAEQIEDFCQICDARCKDAYATGAKWFEKCLNAENGNDMLLMWCKHWLSAYFVNPNLLRKNHAL